MNFEVGKSYYVIEGIEQFLKENGDNLDSKISRNLKPFEEVVVSKSVEKDGRTYLVIVSKLDNQTKVVEDRMVSDKLETMNEKENSTVEEVDKAVEEDETKSKDMNDKENSDKHKEEEGTNSMDVNLMKNIVGEDTIKAFFVTMITDYMVKEIEDIKKKSLEEIKEYYENLTK